MPPTRGGAPPPTYGGLVPLPWWYQPNWADRMGGMELAVGGEKYYISITHHLMEGSTYRAKQK